MVGIPSKGAMEDILSKATRRKDIHRRATRRKDIRSRATTGVDLSMPNSLHGDRAWEQVELRLSALVVVCWAECSWQMPLMEVEVTAEAMEAMEAGVVTAEEVMEEVSRGYS
jgi:hypothetical protein